MNYLENILPSLSVTQRNTLLLICITGIIIISFVLGKAFGKLSANIGYENRLKDERNDAVKRSKAVINGQMVEQIAPFLPDFPCNPADVRFLGKPVDFIAFSGAAEKDSVQEIIFIEVKTGDSKLSEREKQIKEAVEKKRIRYIEYDFNPEKIL